MITLDTPKQSELLDELLTRETGLRECPFCNGTGYNETIDAICPVCQGASLIPASVAQRHLSTNGITEVVIDEGNQLTTRNKAVIETLPKNRRDDFRRLRDLATQYAMGLVDLQAQDGGTMWIPVRAYVSVEVEKLTRNLLAIEAKKGSVHTASNDLNEQVNALLQLAEEELQFFFSHFSRRQLKELNYPDQRVVAALQQLESFYLPANILSIPLLTWCLHLARYASNVMK